MPKLIILGPDAPERQVELTDRDLRIGRDDQNDIVLPDSTKSVSRCHAELKLENGQYVLLDLNSQNGLWVGGRRLAKIALEPGVPVLVGLYRLVLNEVPPEPYTVTGGLPEATPGAIASRVPEPPKPMPVAANAGRAAPGPGRPANLTRSKKAVLFGGVAAFIVLATIVVALRGRISGRIEAPIDRPEPSVVTPPPPASEDLVRTHLTRAKNLLENHDPDGALTELDQVAHIDPLNAEASDLKARANELKSPPPASAPPSPSPPGLKSSPAKPVELPSGPQPVLARKPGESQEEWHVRDRAVATRYDRAKAEVESDSFQAAIRDLNALQQAEPNYLNVLSLLKQTQLRMHAAAQTAMEQGASLEKQGQFPEALQQYRRALQADPSATGAEESIRQVGARMKADGTEAYNTAMTYYTLAKYPQAISLFEKALKLLPDGDPNKKSAQDQLADARKRQ